MPLFKYKAVNQDGQRIESNVFALNEDEAVNSLKAKKIVVVKIEEAKVKVHFWQKSYGHVSFKEKSVFLKYLSSILKAGLSIKKAMEILGLQMKNKFFANIISEIRESIVNGQSFNASLSKYPKVFSAVFVNMIAVGEVSGTLPSVLEYLDKLMTKDYRFKQTIKGAMTYPVVILVLVVSVSVGLIKFIVPRITKIFKSFDVELPLMTRFLIGAESFLSNYWVLLLIAIGCLAVGIIVMLKVRRIRKIFHKVLLRLPVLGGLIKQIQVARFTQIASSLIKSGLPIVKSLAITSKTLKNLVYSDYVVDAVSYIESGGDLSDYLEQRPDLFDPIITQMIRLGEKTGTLDQTMDSIAELNEAEVNEKVKTISGLIGPVMLIIMGLLVGGIAVSVIMPIYQLPTLMRR